MTLSGAEALEAFPGAGGFPKIEAPWSGGGLRPFLERSLANGGSPLVLVTRSGAQDVRAPLSAVLGPDELLASFPLD